MLRCRGNVSWLASLFCIFFQGRGKSRTSRVSQKLKDQNTTMSFPAHNLEPRPSHCISRRVQVLCF